jgi:hypothetical protein
MRLSARGTGRATPDREGVANTWWCGCGHLEAHSGCNIVTLDRTSAEWPSFKYTPTRSALLAGAFTSSSTTNVANRPA